jgi:glycosyltransferase involved in cell wall biosynthesis
VKKDDEMDNCLLTVCVITYNHSNYLKEAIEGILFQQADFQWEIIIADDFSTDGTRELILEYQNKFLIKFN